MRIGDTGATRHSTEYKQGGINSRPSTSRTRGISSQAIKPSMEVDLPGMYCDKNGDDQFAVKLRDVDVIPESHYKEAFNGSNGKQKLKMSINKWLQTRCLKWCCARICQRARRLLTAFG
jgi:hypothetical protein